MERDNQEKEDNLDAEKNPAKSVTRKIELVLYVLYWIVE